MSNLIQINRLKDWALIPFPAVEGYGEPMIDVNDPNAPWLIQDEPEQINDIKTAPVSFERPF